MDISVEQFAEELHTLAPDAHNAIDEVIRLIQEDPSLMLEVSTRVHKKVEALKSRDTKALQEILKQERQELQKLVDQIDMELVQHQLKTT